MNNFLPNPLSRIWRKLRFFGTTIKNNVNYSYLKNTESVSPLMKKRQKTSRFWISRYKKVRPSTETLNNTNGSQDSRRLSRLSQRKKKIIESWSWLSPRRRVTIFHFRTIFLKRRSQEKKDQLYLRRFVTKSPKRRNAKRVRLKMFFPTSITFFDVMKMKWYLMIELIMKKWQFFTEIMIIICINQTKYLCNCRKNSRFWEIKSLNQNRPSYEFCLYWFSQ